MTWIRLDVSFARHRKIKRLNDAAFRLHVTAKCHAGEFLTDGFIHADEVGDLYHSRNIGQLVRGLIDAGLWEEVEGGYQIHDYLEHQESKAQVEARRASDRERKRSGKKSESKQIPAGIQTESKQIPDVDKKRSDKTDREPYIPSDDGTQLRRGLRANGTNPRAIAAKRDRADGLKKWAEMFSHLPYDEFSSVAASNFTGDDLEVILSHRSA